MITILQVDDWTALYKDGVLVEQNHSIGAREIVEACGGVYRWLETDEAAAEFGNDGGWFEGFPERLRP